MKRIMNLRTVRASLVRVEQRLEAIEAERHRLGILRVVLEGQLPPLRQRDIEKIPSVSYLPPVMAESGDCFLAVGAHQHRIIGNKEVCLASEEQMRKQ